MNESVLDKNHIYIKRVITSGDDIFINGKNVFYKITILESKFLKGKENNYQRIKEALE